MNEVEKVTKETIKNGGVLALLYFDIHTRTKEKAQELGASFVQQLLHEKGVAYAVGEIDEPLVNGDLHSTTIQVKILTRRFVNLVNICSIHSPFSVEIIQPDEIRLQLAEAHELLASIGLTTAEYKKYIIENVSKPEEMERFRKIMEAKAELGKRILGRKADKGGTENEGKGQKTTEKDVKGVEKK